MADQEIGCLHLNAWAGIPEEEARKIEWLDYGVAVCGCAARDRCHIMAENISAVPDLFEPFIQADRTFDRHLAKPVDLDSLKITLAEIN